MKPEEKEMQLDIIRRQLGLSEAGEELGDLFDGLLASALMHSNRTSGRYVTEDKSMIAQIRGQIADERISEFLAGMSQLGFTEQEILSLLEKRQEKGE